MNSVRLLCFLLSVLMDPVANERSLESEDYSPSDAEKKASDQFERKL